MDEHLTEKDMQMAKMNKNMFNGISHLGNSF